MFLHADSEDSDQTGRMSRLIWVFTGHTGNFVGFIMWDLIFCPYVAPVYTLKNTSRFDSAPLAIWHTLAGHHTTDLVVLITAVGRHFTIGGPCLLHWATGWVV